MGFGRWSAPTAPPEVLESLRTKYDQLSDVNRQLEAAERLYARLQQLKLHKFSPEGEENVEEYRERKNPSTWAWKQAEPRENLAWLELCDDLVHQSVEVLQRAVQAAQDSRDELLNTREQLRSNIHSIAKPYNRNLGVLDLPDEVLITIFRELRDIKYSEQSFWFWRNNYFPGREDIQRSRLVCRRFTIPHQSITSAAEQTFPGEVGTCRQSPQHWTGR